MMRQRMMFRTVTAMLAGCALAGVALARTGGDAADVAAAESAAFGEADADGDGKLTPDEFASFHELMREKLDALRFTQLDTDGDGGLTQAELEAGRPPRRGPRRPGGGF